MYAQHNQSSLWLDYWRERQVSLQDIQGKGSAVTKAFQIVTELATQSNEGIRILELGCGEGHVLGELLKLCAGADLPIEKCVGIDREATAIENARHFYPAIDFSVADYASGSLELPPFDLVMLVGTLHEVYSSNYSTSLREIDPGVGKQAVHKALLETKKLVKEQGHLIVFDGIEPSFPADLSITIRFKSDEACEEFKKFAAEYEAFQIVYDDAGTDDRVSLSVRDFTRYITKTRFINTALWRIERWESYQYFDEAGFRNSLDELGFEITQLRCSAPHLSDWQTRVSIETVGMSFPDEHGLIVAQLDH